MYSGASYAYIHFATLDSPRYAAATHLRIAGQILANDNGDTASVEDLQVAYQNLVASLTLFPDDRWAHEQLEKVEWALHARGKSPDPEQKRKAAFLGAKFAEMSRGGTSSYPWDPAMNGTSTRSWHSPRSWGATRSSGLWPSSCSGHTRNSRTTSSW